jgi:hypothetical protein
LDLTNLPNPEKLVILIIENNNLSKIGLSSFDKFINLKMLFLGTSYQAKIQKNFYNRFYGSLEPLKSLTKLEVLTISNTDINCGLEHLPKSLERIYCEVSRTGAACGKIKEQLENFFTKKDKNDNSYYDFQM